MLSFDGSDENGYRRYTYEDFTVSAPLSGGVLNGQGKMIWQSGSFFVGTIRKNLFNGFGCWTSSDNQTKKIGYFEDDKFSDGKRYEN